MTNEGLKKKITEIIGNVYLINAPIKDRYKPNMDTAHAQSPFQTMNGTHYLMQKKY